MLDYLAPLCTSVYFCSPPLMAESAPGHPSPIQSVVLFFLPAQRQRCVLLSSQDISLASLSPHGHGGLLQVCSVTLVQSWQGFHVFFFFFSSSICTVSDMCYIAMYMTKCTTDATRLPGCLCGPLQACHLCLIVFSDMHAGSHCDTENGVAASTFIYMYVNCTICGF